MGGYAPLMGLVRGNDCFARFFDWGIRSIDLAHYFDTGFDINQWRNWFMAWSMIGAECVLFNFLWSV